MAEADWSQRAPVAEEARTAPRATAVDRLAWLLVALSPVIFAIATWSPSDIQPSALRSYYIPITVIELLVILAAMRTGFSTAVAFRAIPTWARLALAVLVAVDMGTATLVAPDPVPAAIRGWAWAVHLLFGFAAWHLMRTGWASLRPLIWPSVVAGTCLYVAFVIAFVIAIGDDPKFPWETFGLAVGNIRQTGTYSVIGAAAAIGLAATARGGARYWSAVAAAALMLALSYWSGTRGSLVALPASFACALLVLPSLRRWRALLALVIANLAGALLSLVHFAPHPNFGMFRISRSAAGAVGDEIASGRLSMWAGTVRVALERPLFGWGESQFRTVVPEALGTFNHPHNVFLQIWLQWGLVGLFCCCALGAYAGWHFIRRARQSEEEVAPAFLVATGLFALALVDGPLFYPYGVMMLAVCLAFVLAPPQRTQAVSPGRV